MRFAKFDCESQSFSSFSFSPSSCFRLCFFLAVVYVRHTTQTDANPKYKFQWNVLSVSTCVCVTSRVAFVCWRLHIFPIWIWPIPDHLFPSLPFTQVVTTHRRHSCAYVDWNVMLSSGNILPLMKRTMNWDLWWTTVLLATKWNIIRWTNGCWHQFVFCAWHINTCVPLSIYFSFTINTHTARASNPFDA